MSNIDLSEMLGRHFKAGASATLAVTRGFEVPVGVAKLDGTRVEDWIEKPTVDIFAGMGMVVLNPDSIDVLESIVVGKDSLDIMGDLIPYFIKEGRRVEAYITDAFWYDVGSTEKYEKIDNGLIERLLTFVD